MNNPYLYIINAIAPLQMDKLKYGREFDNSNSVRPTREAGK